MSARAEPAGTARIDPHRYRRVMAFFFRVFLHAFFWDLLLLKGPLRLFRRPPLERWARITARFRGLAVEMGGVLIKLGQFLSTRVDLLPREITGELSGLQDEVAAAPFDEIVAQVEDDFGRPWGEVFAELDPVPLGAASLAQVHPATLHDGREVVVKVLRPGIDVLVETDLRALSIAIRGLRLWRFVRRRVDLDRLVKEFVSTTRRELDMQAEGRHAERFAEEFASDEGVIIPKVYWRQSGRRTLTLENVGFLKLGDIEAMEEAGVDLKAVAARLYDVYLRQVFVHNFVHADPHPGNLFVRPQEDGKFQIAFVDFGMVAVIPERLREAMREYVIALGTRDAYRIVQAYQQAGMILPGADLKRLEEAHEAVFERFWGVQIGDLRDRALEEIGPLLSQYRDLILDYPFQAQVDLLFVQRAIEILIGLVTSLDPSFDLWNATRPFARRLAREGELFPQGEWLPEIFAQAKTALALPARFDRVLTAAERGNLSVKSTLGPDSRKAARRLERAVGRLTGMAAAAGLLVAGSVLYSTEAAVEVGLVAMGLSGLVALITMLRR